MKYSRQSGGSRSVAPSSVSRNEPLALERYRQPSSNPSQVTPYSPGPDASYGDNGKTLLNSFGNSRLTQKAVAKYGSSPPNSLIQTTPSSQLAYLPNQGLSNPLSYSKPSPASYPKTSPYGKSVSRGSSYVSDNAASAILATPEGGLKMVTARQTTEFTEVELAPPQPTYYLPSTSNYDHAPERESGYSIGGSFEVYEAGQASYLSNSGSFQAGYMNYAASTSGPSYSSDSSYYLTQLELEERQQLEMERLELESQILRRNLTLSPQDPSKGYHNHYDYDDVDDLSSRFKEL